MLLLIINTWASAMTLSRKAFSAIYNTFMFQMFMRHTLSSDNHILPWLSPEDMNPTQSEMQWTEQQIVGTLGLGTWSSISSSCSNPLMQGWHSSTEGTDIARLSVEADKRRSAANEGVASWPCLWEQHIPMGPVAENLQWARSDTREKTFAKIWGAVEWP